MRKVLFADGEFYHIYNRGVDKRNIFSDERDVERFLQSMEEFNTVDPIGSIYENSFRKNKPQLGSSASKLGSRERKLVNFVAYCLNDNHYHFILEQVSEDGIKKMMHKLGTGYTKYFNNKQKRSGVLFQGKFKATHVASNEYLLHLSAYVNLNERVHQLGSRASKLGRSSWREYVEKENKKDHLGECENFCTKDIVLDQFSNKLEYKKFALDSLQDILKNKKDQKELKKMGIEF